MPRSLRVSAPSRAVPGDVAPATTPDRALHVSWLDVCVEHLDLDQFDDAGRLRRKRYRHRPPTIAPAVAVAVAVADAVRGEGR